MHRSAIALAVATLAVGGQAFIIPPNMNKDAINNAEFILLNGADPNNRVLKAECKSCLEDGKDGALIYDLVITNLGTPKFLINGADLAPINLHTNYLDFLELMTPPPFLSVPLVPAESTLAELATTDLKPKEAKVMYNYYSEIGTAGDAEIFKLVLEPTSVDGRQISHDATAKIEVQILIVEDGKMIIFDAQAAEDDSRNPSTIEEDCGFFCEMMDKLIGWGRKAEEKVGAWGKKFGAKFKPCEKNANGEAEIGSEPIITGGNAPEPKKDEKTEEETLSILPVVPIPDRTPTSSWRRPPHSRPDYRPHHSEEDEGHRHARPWSHHHHYHHRPHHMSHNHGAGSALYRIFVQVLVPIAIGIVAGMLVSLMGMVVGHFAVLAYQKAVRAVNRARSAPELEGAKDEEEVSKGLLSEEEYRDAPPEYDGEGREEVIQEKQ